MTVDLRNARRSSYEAHLSAWVCLRHFLSADLLEELADAATSLLSGGQTALDDLFLSDVSGKEPFLSTWMLIPRSERDTTSIELQRVIRHLAIQTDEILYISGYRGGDHHPAMIAIEQGLTLAPIDYRTLGDWERATRQPDASLVPLAEAIRCAADVALGKAATTTGVLSSLAAMPDPLRLLATKHLGDLFLDEDDAEHANQLYEEALRIGAKGSDPAWCELHQTVLTLTRLSIASVLELSQGPEAASAALAPIYSRQPTWDEGLARANAALDYMNAQIRADARFPDDIRATIVSGPQLVFNLTSLLGLTGPDSAFDDAHRRLWAVLRRSRALGSATEAKRVSNHYGRSILRELELHLRTRRAPDAFLMAIALLLKGSPDADIGDEARSEALLDVYLDNAVIDRVIAITTANPGVRDDRIRLAVKLFSAWAIALPTGANELVARLLGWIAETGASYADDEGADKEIWRLCLDELKRVPLARPGLAQLASRTVTNLIVMTVRQNRFRLSWAALETATAYADGLDIADLKRCAETALDVLESTEPADAAWPVVRPALQIICSPELKDTWTHDTDLGRRTARTMLRYGLGMSGEGPRLLAYLDDLAPYLDRDTDSIAELAKLVSDMCERAQAISNSGATAYMSALLHAPHIVGTEGLLAALRGLRAMLQSSMTSRPSIALADGAWPIHALSQNIAVIQAVTDASGTAIQTLLDEIANGVEQVWQTASDRPEIMAGFAIPPRTAADPVYVKNWAFATIEFAQAIERPELFTPVLDTAARHRDLREPIALARADRLPDNEPESAMSISPANRKDFYAQLAWRLAQIPRLGHAQRQRLAATLLDETLQFGPHWSDAAVMTAALSNDVQRSADRKLRLSYERRLTTEPEMRAVMLPLLKALPTGRSAT